MSMLIKGMFIGMLVSIPIGPLGIMSIQRTINSGWKVGFFSGVGAAASDIFYSLCAVFGISIVHDILIKYNNLINEITGILFLVLGVNIFLNALNNKLIKEERKRLRLNPALSNFLLGLSNPMTFIIFLTLFTKMGMNLVPEKTMLNLMFVLSIFTGSSIFWLITSNFINNSKRNFNIEAFSLFNKIIGVLIALFGAYSILRGLLKV